MCYGWGGAIWVLYEGIPLHAAFNPLLCRARVFSLDVDCYFDDEIVCIQSSKQSSLIPRRVRGS